MNATKAELIAGVAGGGTFLATLVAMAWPWWLCTGLTLLVYGGLNLLLGGVVDSRVQQMIGTTQGAIAQLRGQAAAGRRTVDKLQRLSKTIDDEQMRARVRRVCDIATKIFDNFEDDPEDIKRSHRFLSQFHKLLPIVENYVHLSSDPDRRQVLTDDDEASIGATLDDLYANLKDVYRAYQENNLQQLRMSTGTLKRMLDMENAIRKDK